MLDMAQLEGGKIEKRQEMTDVNGVISEIVDTLELNAQSLDIKIDFHQFKDELKIMSIDPQRLQ